MKTIMITILLVLSLASVSAVPQVVFTSINLSIVANNTSITYTLSGEGLSATETVPLNMVLTNSTNVSLNFSLIRNNIPITISRDICGNTDTAILMNSLANNNNISSMWQDCVKNLSICQTNRVDNVNFSILQQQYQNCNTQGVIKDSSITVKDADISNLQSQRLLIGAAAIGAGIAAYYFWRRTSPKTVVSPGLSQLPRNQKI